MKDINSTKNDPSNVTQYQPKYKQVLKNLAVGNINKASQNNFENEQNWSTYTPNFKACYKATVI